MGSNLHPSCCVADWNLAGACNQNAMEQQFKLSYSFSSCQWLLLQPVSRSTTLTCQDRQRSVLSDLFPNTNREIQTPGDIPVHFTQHGAHRMTLHLEQIFPFLFIPFLFIPFYLSPSEAHVTPLLSGIYLRSKFIWLDSRSFLNNFQCFAELQLLYKQQTLLGLLNRLILHLGVVFVMKKLHGHQTNTSILQIQHHRMLCATGEKRMGGQGHSSCSSTASRGCMWWGMAHILSISFSFPRGKKKKNLSKLI